MKRHGLHEDAIDQIVRLMRDDFAATTQLDDERRVRLDDWEMRPDVHTDVARIWADVQTTGSLEGIDVDAFVTDFERLFGFSVPEIDYSVPVETAPGLRVDRERSDVRPHRGHRDRRLPRRRQDHARQPDPARGR
jgi:trans-2-enoyl-CoA reductase